MESLFDRSPDVRRRFEKMVLVQLYVDGPGAKAKFNKDYQESKYNISAQGYYAIEAPDGTILGTKPLTNRNVDDYVAFMDDCLKKFETWKTAQK